METTSDVKFVANAKLMETANKSAQSISRRCRSRANRALISRPWNRAIILFESFDGVFSNAGTTRENTNENGVSVVEKEATKKYLPGEEG